MHVLVGQVAAAGQVDARDLEQRDPPRAGVAVALRRLDEARQQRRAQRGQLDGDRLRAASRSCRRPGGGSACTSRRTRARRAHPRRGAAVAAARQRSEHRASRGQRERHGVEPEARDLLDDVDLARHVARAPRRHDDAVAVALEAEPAEDRVLPLGRRLDADHLVGPRRPEATTGRSGSSPCTSVCAVQVAPGQLEQQPVASSAAGLGEVRVDALLPAVRALGAQPQPLGRAEDAVRLEVRGLEQHARRRVADLGLLAAHDPGERDAALGVGDHEVVGLSSRSTPSSVRSFSPGRRGGRRSARRERREVEGVQRAAEREHHVVRDVDDVRDRAHPGGDEPARSHSGDGPTSTSSNRRADVARAAARSSIRSHRPSGTGRRSGTAGGRGAAGRRAPRPRGRCRRPTAGRAGCRSTRRAARPR